MAAEVEPLLTVDEVAEITRLSAKSVRRAIKRSDLVAVRFGRSVRVRTNDLSDFIDRHTGRTEED